MNIKIWFLVLLAGAFFCAGCANVAQMQQDEMARARALVSQSGQALTAEQAEVMTLVLYSQMEQERVQRQIAAAQMIHEGFQNAGDAISQSTRYNAYPQYVPVAQPTLQGPQIPQTVIQPVFIPQTRVGY
jgi:hypothetical protein